MKPLAKPEDPAAVQAALTAVLERPATPRRVHAWACARCGDDRKTEDAPPKPRLCPRCAARTLEMHTEPATPKRYGDDDEDDGAPLELSPAWRSSAPPPVAREPIQADTPSPAPACPIGEPAAPTATAEEGEKMAKVEEKKGVPMPALAEPWKCDRAGCDFTAATAQRRGVHLLRAHGIKGTSNGARSWAAKAASKITAPKPSAAYKCETCGKGFSSGAALGGHRNTHTSVKAKKEPVTPAPAPVRAEPPSLRCLVVRVRGAVPLEVECATAEDAAAFVRLVAGTPGAKTEARG